MKVNKAAVKSKMLQLKEQELLYATSHYNEYLKGARLDRSEATDEQDRAETELNSRLAEQFHCPLEDHEKAYAILDATDFSEKSSIRSGAIIRFNGNNFVIAIAGKSFECEGQSFIGISTAAPIYQALEGLEQGDTIEFNGSTHTLELVY